MSHEFVLFTTEMVTDKLTDEELATLHIFATSGWKATGEELGYEKWRRLLTEENKTKLHSVTIEALEQIVAARLATKETR